MVLLLQSFIWRINPDGTLPFEEVRAEVRTQAEKYLNLVLQPNTAHGCAEAAKHGLIETLDIYELLHLIRRQTSWAATDRVEKSSAASVSAASSALRIRRNATASAADSSGMHVQAVLQVDYM